MNPPEGSDPADAFVGRSIFMFAVQLIQQSLTVK